MAKLPERFSQKCLKGLVPSVVIDKFPLSGKRVTDLSDTCLVVIVSLFSKRK